MEQIKLVPELVEFKVNTTYLNVQLEERESLPVIFEAQKLTQHSKLEILKGDSTDGEIYWSRIKIVFPLFAEVNYKMLNFFESEHGNFHIKNDYFDLDRLNENAYFFGFWAQNNTHPNPGFYQIQDSSLLKKIERKYDPNNNYKLKHFLITGYDSHVEIIASESYSIEEV